MEDYVIVVARYAETGDALAWLEPHAALSSEEESPKICIQNKGSLDTLPPSLRPFARPLPNLGLDQYCHLDYIVEHYDRLPELLLFTQAGLGDHLDVHEPELRHDVLKTVGTMHIHTATLDAPRVVDAMLRQTYHFGHTLNAMTYMLRGGGFCARRHGDITTHHPDEATTGMCFGEWFERLLQRPFPAERDFRWFKNAIFGVRRAHVLSRPRAFYQALLRQIRTPRGEVLHYIERSWYYILNLDVDMVPHGFMAAVRGARGVFRTLSARQALLHAGVEAESAVWTGEERDPYHDSVLHKQVNVFELARNARGIMQFGLGTGHAAALMLLASTHSILTIFDDDADTEHKRDIFNVLVSAFPGRCSLLQWPEAIARASVARESRMPCYTIDLDRMDLLYVSSSEYGGRLRQRDIKVTYTSRAILIVVDGVETPADEHWVNDRICLCDYRGTRGHYIGRLDCFLMGDDE